VTDDVSPRFCRRVDDHRFGVGPAGTARGPATESDHSRQVYSLIAEASTTRRALDLRRLLRIAMSRTPWHVTSGRIDCGMGDRKLDDLERSIALAAGATLRLLFAIFRRSRRYGTDRSGATRFAIRGRRNRSRNTVWDCRHLFWRFKGAGRQMKLGIEIAFNRVNDAAASRPDAQLIAPTMPSPARNAEAEAVYEKDQVSVIGNANVPRSGQAVPYSVERRMLSSAVSQAECNPPR